MGKEWISKINRRPIKTQVTQVTQVLNNSRFTSGNPSASRGSKEAAHSDLCRQHLSNCLESTAPEVGRRHCTLATTSWPRGAGGTSGSILATLDFLRIQSDADRGFLSSLFPWNPIIIYSSITHRIHVWYDYMLTWLGYIDGKYYHI